MSDVFPESIAPYFDAEFYLAQNPDVAAAGIDPLDHYKEWGWREGRCPAPWFDPADYKLRFPDLVALAIDPFAHFAAHGDPEAAIRAHRMAYRLKEPAPARALLTGRGKLAADADVYLIRGPDDKDVQATAPHFDAEYYLNTYPDVAASLVDPLLHFLTVGWLEGRNPSPDFSVLHYLKDNPDVRKARINPFAHYCRYGRNENWRRSIGVVEATVLDAFESDEALMAMVSEAIALEPMVALPDVKCSVSIPVRTQRALAQAARALREALTGKIYRLVVLVPHIRMSGAARVSSIFARVLAETAGDDHILVVITDSPEAEYKHWLPDNCDVFDASAIFGSVEDDLRSQLLYDLLHGVEAQVFVNINSRLAWKAMEDYGRQLSQEFRVFTYLFTWDETVNGNRVGYPIQWLRHTCDQHHVIFTDNHVLSQNVRERFGYGDDDCQVITLHTPPDESKFAAILPDSRRRRPVFLWAGRFDRQKRTDILIAVARACPQAVFHVYGKAVLDKQGLSEDDFPENCILKGTYQALAEVFQEEVYSGFLYTSQWDGIPTILLDMGSVGLPIIASDVGGIAELVNAETGWLVEPFDDVDAYVDAIRQISEGPAEAAQRAAAMKRHLATDFSVAAYRDAIREVLKRHGL